MKLINKDALVAEIDILRKSNELKEDKDYAQFELDVSCGYDMALDDIKTSIDTFEVKEVDLEKETKKWWKEHLHLDPKNQLWMDAHQSIVFAKHFFELGMQVSNKAQKGEEV